MTASPQPERIAALDGVRGLAILLVLCMHCLYIAPRYDLGFITTHTYGRVAMLGWSGVDVFFVLSGFLITGILVRGKGQAAGPYFRNFYMRRSLRIFPLYYLVIILLLYVLPNRSPATGGEQMSYLLYYQNIRYACFGELAFDPARLITWSLAIEEQFYLVWPAVVWFTSERLLRRVCVAMIAVAIALRIVLIASGFEGTHFLTPCRMDALAVGALLSLMPPPRAWFGACATVLGVAGLITAAYATGNSTPESAGQQMWGLIPALLLGVGLLCLARTSRRLQPVFTLLPLRSLGKYSYCIYLTHLLVIEFFTKFMVKWVPVETYPPLLVVIAFTIACCVGSWLLAIISWHLFEKWFLALKRYFPSSQGAEITADTTLDGCDVKKRNN